MPTSNGWKVLPKGRFHNGSRRRKPQTPLLPQPPVKHAPLSRPLSPILTHKPGPQTPISPVTPKKARTEAPVHGHRTTPNKGKPNTKTWVPARTGPGFETTILEHAMTLEVPPVALTSRRDRLIGVLDRMPNTRCTIRSRNDAERELRKVESDIDEYSSGAKKRAYLCAAQPYLQAYQKIAHVDDKRPMEEISRSLARFTKQQLTAPFRRRSNLERTIRVASQTDQTTSAHSLMDEFMSSSHGSSPPVYMNHVDLCPECTKPLCKEADNTLACSECGYTIHTQDANVQNVSYNDERNFGKFQYNQAGHFREHLKKISSIKTDVDVSEPCRLVMAQLLADGVPTEGVSFNRVRTIVEGIEKKRWTQHAVRIWCDITGQPKPTVSAEERGRLSHRFMMVASLFSELAPDRCNMASYPFLIRKFCVLEGFYHLVPFFPVPKGQSNRENLETIFRELCQKVNWPYISYEDESDIPELKRLFD